MRLDLVRGGGMAASADWQTICSAATIRREFEVGRSAKLFLPPTGRISYNRLSDIVLRRGAEQKYAPGIKNVIDGENQIWELWRI